MYLILGATLHLFDRASGSGEMARIAASYIARFGADHVWIERCGRYAWVRLKTDTKEADPLFALSPRGAAAPLHLWSLPGQ